MRKGTLLRGSLVLLVLLFCRLPLMAQYEHVLQPQSQDEVALYKKLKVRMEKKEVDGTNTQISNSLLVFSPEGRIMGYMDAYERQYYMYDAAGHVVALLDSVRGEDNAFQALNYLITYDEKNHPASIRMNNKTSTFVYNPDKFSLSETLTTDSPAKNIYRYNPYGKLTESISYDRWGHKMERHALNYNEQGLVSREYLIRYIPNGKDSISAFYFYNDDKTLKTKQVFDSQSWITATDRTGTPTNKASHNDAGVYSYTYNDKGQLISEKYSSSLGETKSYSISYEYDPNGLKVKETQRYAKMDAIVIHYQYSFYE